MSPEPEYPFFFCRRIKRPLREAQITVEVIDHSNDLLLGIETLYTNEHGYSERLDGLLVDQNGRPIKANVDITRDLLQITFGAESLDINGHSLIESARRFGVWPPEGFNKS